MLSRDEMIALREHPRLNPLPGPRAAPSWPLAGEGAGHCFPALSRLRERERGEVGLSRRTRQAHRTASACKPMRALQVRVAAQQEQLFLRERRAPTGRLECSAVSELALAFRTHQSPFTLRLTRADAADLRQGYRVGYAGAMPSPSSTGAFATALHRRGSAARSSVQDHAASGLAAPCGT